MMALRLPWSLISPLCPLELGHLMPSTGTCWTELKHLILLIIIITVPNPSLYRPNISSKTPVYFPPAYTGTLDIPPRRITPLCIPSMLDISWNQRPGLGGGGCGHHGNTALYCPAAGSDLDCQVQLLSSGSPAVFTPRPHFPDAPSHYLGTVGIGACPFLLNRKLLQRAALARRHLIPQLNPSHTAL